MAGAALGGLDRRTGHVPVHIRLKSRFEGHSSLATSSNLL